MNTQHSRVRGLAAAALAVFALAIAGAKPASAQVGPNTWTQEGKQIKNKATASFTDARDNTYDDVESNEVTVTVGFKGSIGVEPVATPLTFTQGTTGNTASFKITNYGNGPDSVKYTFTNSNPTTFTNLQYCLPDGPDGDTDPDCYASIAALRAALVVIPSGGDIVMTIVFDVAAGSGSKVGQYTLVGQSGRDATSPPDDGVIDLSVDLTGDVAVTAGGPDTKVPTNYNGTTRLYYQAQFTVTNNMSGDEDFDISAVMAPGSDADIEIMSVTLCSDVSTPITSTFIGFSGTASVCVLYNIKTTANAADAGSITLTATSQDNATTTDSDDYSITVIKPSLSLVKKAFLADGTTEITTEKPTPGQDIIYEIRVKNEGGAPATSVSITDVLPGEVDFVSTSDDGSGWTINTASAPTITGALASLGASSEAWFRIRVTIK